MTRQDALEQLTALSTPAILAAMQSQGYTGDGNYDDITRYVTRWLDRSAKTSAATLAPMTDWQQVIAHATGKSKQERPASLDTSTIVGKGWRIEFNAIIGRTQVVFDKFPRKEARELVKAAGFCWSPAYGAWQKKLTNKARRAAEALAPQLAAIRVY